MVKKYESISLFPLEFSNGQQVEAGETFERDFETTEPGPQHETWLINTGHIRIVMDIPKPPARTSVVDVNAKKE